MIIKGGQRIQELWSSLGTMKEEFEIMERPLLEIERPETPGKHLYQRSSSARMQSPREKYAKSPKLGKALSLKLISAIPDSKSILGKGAKSPDVLSKYKMALDEESREGSMEDIDWEFDALISPRPFPTEHTSSQLAKLSTEQASSPLTKVSTEQTSSPLARMSTEQAESKGDIN